MTVGKTTWRLALKQQLCPKLHLLRTCTRTLNLLSSWPSKICLRRPISSLIGPTVETKVSRSSSSTVSTLRFRRRTRSRSGVVRRRSTRRSTRCCTLPSSLIGRASSRYLSRSSEECLLSKMNRIFSRPEMRSVLHFWIGCLISRDWSSWCHSSVMVLSKYVKLFSIRTISWMVNSSAIPLTRRRKTGARSSVTDSIWLCNQCSLNKPCESRVYFLRWELRPKKSPNNNK